MAGCDKIQSHKRNINLQDALRMVGDLNQLFKWEHDPSAPLKLDRTAHVKMEYQNKYHEPTTGDDADLTDYPSHDEANSAFERGLVRARTDARALGMTASEELMAEPWLGESRLTDLMRDAGWR